MTSTIIESVPVTVDVSGRLPFGDEINTITGDYHPSQEPSGAGAATVLVCWPGGSYNRSYWDFDVPGHPGYSFARYMASLGYIVVNADPLGVGSSSAPAVGETVDLEMMGAACDEFVQQVRVRLSQGTLHDSLAPCDDVTMVGIGHSLGGALTMVTQATQASYDRLCVLGYNNGVKDVVDDAFGPRVEEVEAAAITQAKGFFKETWDDVYGLVDRAEHFGWLYGPYTEDAVIALDAQFTSRWPRRPYVEALMPGFTSRYAAEIRVPLFLGFGELDVTTTPHAEPSFYPNSTDVTLHLLEGSAHCHNMARSRHAQWDRIARWLTSL